MTDGNVTPLFDVPKAQYDEGELTEYARLRLENARLLMQNAMFHGWIDRVEELNAADADEFWHLLAEIATDAVLDL